MEFDLPIVVAGEVVHPDQVEALHHLEFDDGDVVRLPALTPAMLQAAVRQTRELTSQLAQLTIYDVTSFLAAAGWAWIERRWDLRSEAEELASRITGYAEPVIRHDYQLIAEFLGNRPIAYDLVESNLGDERLMDEWCRSKAAWVRAFPRGVVLHYLVGNLPVASLGSLVYGCLTKNVNLAKLPTRDPVTSVAFARTLLQVDANHPLARSMTVAYWPHTGDVAESAFELADAVCAWGGSDAIAYAKSRARPGVPVVEFGPRWSLAVIDLDRCDAEKAAWRLATEVSFYDQEACFSPQRLFIKGQSGRFLGFLRKYLDIASTRIPKTTSDRDAQAHLAMTRLEAAFRGWTVHQGHGWSVIEVSRPSDVEEHPLGRTLFVHHVEDIGMVTPWLNSNAQTLACEPWSLALEYRDQWALAGVDRIVEVGFARDPHVGYTHDGMRPLEQLVRLVCLEQGFFDWWRYHNMDYRGEDFTGRSEDEIEGFFSFRS